VICCILSYIRVKANQDAPAGAARLGWRRIRERAAAAGA
jgi:hypothetical protein